MKKEQKEQKETSTNKKVIRQKYVREELYIEANVTVELIAGEWTATEVYCATSFYTGSLSFLVRELEEVESALERAAELEAETGIRYLISTETVTVSYIKKTK